LTIEIYALKLCLQAIKLEDIYLVWSMNLNLNNEIKRVANLKQNKGKSKAFIEHQAQINIWRRQIDIESKFVQEDDKIFAKKLFDDYLTNYDFNSLSDLNTLADLVCEEVLKTNLQRKISEMRSNDQIPNDKKITSLHNVEERVLKLKEILNLNKTKEQDDLSALQDLEKKFNLYIPFNRNEFSTSCAKCGTMLLLRRRVKDFECLKHPFFSGRFYYNRRGMELIKAKIWTKEQYAWAFHTSVDYVNWCLKNEDKIIDIEGEDEDSINNFINSKPYLKKQKIPKNIKKDLGDKK